MNRYFIKLQYDGTPYHGWQSQPNANTVQAEIEKALQIYFQRKISVLGCGRTDTGVHATEFYAHADFEQELDVSLVVFKLNSILPNSIAIDNILKVDSESHARFDAKLRGYEYKIHQTKNPFLEKKSWFQRKELNVDLMNKACLILKETTEFASFCKIGSENKTTNCYIKEMNWVTESNYLIFKVSADRFLRNMVRALVGTLIEVGRGKMTLDELRLVIKLKDRSKAGTSVPAHGLYLVKVEYDIFQ